MGQLVRLLPFYYYAERSCEDLLPGGPGGLTGSRYSSYETCLDRQAWRILANALCFLGAGTFQKDIWDYQVREEIVTKGTGRETQKRGELGRRGGNLCEEQKRRMRPSFRWTKLLELLLRWNWIQTWRQGIIQMSLLSFLGGAFTVFLQFISNKI